MTNSYASYYHTYAHLFKCGTSQEILKLSTTDINLYKDVTIASEKKLNVNGDLTIMDDYKFILGKSEGSEFFH